jgi:large repetitive protein
VTVVPPAIVAVDDNYGMINGTTGNPNVGNALLENDLLNGAPVVLADITATVLTPATPIMGGPVPVLDPMTGIVSVPAGTPAGTYTITYQICENLNPANCDDATITVTVVPPAIVAVDDNYGMINGTTGAPNVGNALLENDLLNGAPVVLADITATVLTPATPIMGGPVPVLNTTTGVVSVPAGTPAGTYTINYQICENLNPANCDDATITVTVVPPAIVANDDPFGPTNGTTGDPNLGNAFDNDLLNGAPVVLADITATVLTPATPIMGGPVPVLDPMTGIVSVPAGTPAGTYTITYQICENLNPGNCDDATITVTVVPPAIVAVDDNYGMINGTTGDPNVGRTWAMHCWKMTCSTAPR